jgi:hypothetical protein
MWVRDRLYNITKSELREDIHQWLSYFYLLTFTSDYHIFIC